MAWTKRDVLKGLGASASLPFIARAGWAQQGAVDLDAFYEQAIVIDSLSFAHEWDEAEYAALDRSGYTGMITSLPRRDLKTAIDALMEWKQRIAEHPDRFIPGLTADDFRRAKREGKVAVMMNFQNATMLEGDLDNVDVLYELGTRCFQLTYNQRNRLGDGSTERTNAGLSDFGIAVVERMNDLGIMIDLSHCGAQTTMDGIAFSEKPVAFTHTMCEALRPGHPRAKTDAQIRALAGKGGVVGIAMLGYFIGRDPGGETTIKTYVDHVDHAVNLAGIDHVAMSTDFPVRGISPWATREEWYEPRLESFKPSYDVQWPPWIPDLDSPDRYRNVIRVLDRRGYSTGEMEKLLGLNWLRHFETVFGT